ncbi:T9SS C-terminal target domain-containing protein [Chryseotalea sanaruensis]|uniref:T9SS C-terminal target domain-containing protein n=1 Tax=Chryseotalea sanaruensis TaxID=2482724 RepID=A0A401UCQ1_9BACT|nr:alpha-amylase family glycosyl hydrolase [Chryseotalea sanaruensis]GCC52659.1 T9SS C-terminal target domain-containing protein [Chryseotalea sanaruensis]
MILKSLRTLLLGMAISLPCWVFAQNDVMMQGFYWDVPVDAANFNGSWWNNLKNKSTTLKNAGITGIWVPSPAKGNFGIYDMGYGIFDLYDLGNYNQKGTTETRFGSRTELEQMISQFHTDGIDVYADIVLNHLYTGDGEDQSNPAVKQYVFDEAYRNSQQFSPYPTNEIRWVIKNATAGDYFIQIHGYHLASTAKTERGYDLQIDYNSTGFNSTNSWEAEPNNGGGNFNTFPASGNTVRGHIEVGDFDEYKITVSGTRDVIIKLTSRKEIASPWEWAWADQTNGYYPKAIWKSGTNIATTAQLEAHTNTGINYVNHTGTGEANFSWTYSDFHPVDNSDWLGYPGSDEIITNTKFFGNDLNTFNTTVANRYKDWGVWLSNQIGFDGYRLDFVRGFQESYAAAWVNNLPLKNGNQRFIVGEYWGSDSRIKDWVNTVGGYGADVDGFDFPLKISLTNMCNGNGSGFDMRWLNNTGMVRNNGGNSLPGTSVVTWLENHDTGKEHDKWITKDWKIGYAYILTHEGRPCVFYNHYFGDVMIDAHNSGLTVTPDSNLDTDIRKLVHVRKTYLGGTLTVLSQVGNPYPSGDAYNVYVARRAGNGTKSGAIVVINNHDSQTKGIWVDVAPSGWGSWTNQTLVNAFNSSETVTVYSDGRAYFSAPPRSYAVYVRQSEYVQFTDPGVRSNTNEPLEEIDLLKEGNDDPEFQVWGNPIKDKVSVLVSTPRNQNLQLTFYTIKGEAILDMQTMTNRTTEIDFSTYPKGMYILRASSGKMTRTKKLIKD